MNSSKFCHRNALKQADGQLGQFAAFPLFQVDVGIEALALHFFDQVTQPIGLAVQIRVVNLKNVAGKNHFGPLSGPGDNRFDFMWGEVLGFVDDEKSLHDAAPADIGKRRDEDFFIIQQLLDF